MYRNIMTTPVYLRYTCMQKIEVGRAFKPANNMNSESRVVDKLLASKHESANHE
jgi:hypothetical protein